jgi:hypothetical protein
LEQKTSTTVTTAPCTTSCFDLRRLNESRGNETGRRQYESFSVSSNPPYDPLRVLGRLAAAGVDFVVVGGVAGAAHGSAYPTYDIDVAYARDQENLEKIVQVLNSLGARLRGAPPHVPFRLDSRSLAEGGNFTFDTDAGPVDIFAFPDGAPAYERMKDTAMISEIDGHEIRFASLDHLIGMKEAAGRSKDKLMATEYRALADEIRRRKEQGEVGD